MLTHILGSVPSYVIHCLTAPRSLTTPAPLAYRRTSLLDVLWHLHRPALCASSHLCRYFCGPLTRSSDIYHVSFPNDHRFIQASVYIIFLLDIFQSIVAASEGWQFLVNGWGRQVNLAFPGWTFTALPIVSSLGAYFVHPLSVSADRAGTSRDSLTWGASILRLENMAARPLENHPDMHHSRTFGSRPFVRPNNQFTAAI